MVLLRRCLKELKERTVCVFENHSETRLFTMKLHHLDPLCKELDKFESVRLLGASEYEYFLT